MQRELCEGLGVEATPFADQKSNNATQGGVSSGD